MICGGVISGKCDVTSRALSASIGTTGLRFISNTALLLMYKYVSSSSVANIVSSFKLSRSYLVRDTLTVTPVYDDVDTPPVRE